MAVTLQPKTNTEKIMNKTRTLLLAILLIGICCGISAKTLVVYYSYTNNVRTIVNELATQKEVDVVEIQPAKEGQDYAANNYALGTQLLNAINAAPNDASSYPEIKPVSVDFTQYDDIIIATPLWWSQMAAPMQTFLFNNGAAMEGKNIWMIVSSASSGISGVVADAERLIPDGNFQGNQLWIESSQVSQATSMLNTWLLETGQVSAINNQKMVVLSDPHVMAPGLLLSEGTAWTTYLNGQRKLVDYSQRLFDDMIVRIKRNLRPGLVLISGDLTKDGERASHQIVASQLQRLVDAGIQVLVVPGNHDINNNGFSLDEKITLAESIGKYMTVYISSEKQLPETLAKYKLSTPAAQIHNVLANADLYVGDSQTMAAEAALLGTPAIRSNSFVGDSDMSNFKMLEKKYGLLRNIRDFDTVLSTAIDFAKSSRKEEWKRRRETYYSSVGNTNEYIADLLER